MYNSLEKKELIDLVKQIAEKFTYAQMKAQIVKLRPV